ncbi:MAG: hypothetical protein AAF570_04460 [Bacteroidota bacterium]
MASQFPEFDFSSYNPRDPWNVPPQRLVHFAFSAMKILKPSRSKWLRIKPYPDIRSVAFHELHAECHSLGVQSMLMRENARSLEWWNAQPELSGRLDKQAMLANNIALRGMLRYGFVQMLSRELEAVFRQVLRNLDPEARENKGAGFRKVWKALLAQTGLEHYEPVIQLLLVIRDSTLHNGKFCPVNRKNLRIRYKDKTCTFLNNAEVDVQEWGFVDMWDFILFLVKEMNQLLNELFESPFVALIHHIRARSLEDPAR